MIPGIITAILLVTFLAGVLWAYSPRRGSEFAEAERLALDDDASSTPSKSQTKASP
jgi:cytochrome c oxidase cbb3-type subunit IV